VLEKRLHSKAISENDFLTHPGSNVSGLGTPAQELSTMGNEKGRTTDANSLQKYKRDISVYVQAAGKMAHSKPTLMW
jgi:hypothetical protein